MKTLLTSATFLLSLLIAVPVFAQDNEITAAESSLSLITDTAEEGFQLAITLSRKGVTETQSDREVLFRLRDVYANDPDALIASSQVIAIHFQTIAAANNYWRTED